MIITPAVSLATYGRGNYARNRRKPAAGWHCLDTRSQIVYLLLFSQLLKKAASPRLNRRGPIEALAGATSKRARHSLRALIGAAPLKRFIRKNYLTAQGILSAP